MPRFVDGFLLPIPKGKITEYRRISNKAGKVWVKYGALEYRECVGKDLRSTMGSFKKAARAKPNETVMFSWIVYRSRADRDRINKRVMKDPLMAKMMTPEAMPFDYRRMAMGGFEMIVDL